MERAYRMGLPGPGDGFPERGVVEARRDTFEVSNRKAWVTGNPIVVLPSARSWTSTLESAPILPTDREIGERPDFGSQFLSKGPEPPHFFLTPS